VAAPSSSAEALRIVSALLAFPGISVLPTPAGVVGAIIELLKRHPVPGGEIFDLQIVAIMKGNDIRRIYTFNSADFQVFPELIVIVPSA
jgi:predicted nucleic acid-binding protein